MQLNPASLFLLKKISAKKRADNRSSVTANHQGANPKPGPKSKSHTERFQNWLSPKPAAIQVYPGEQEIFRKGLVLVTDTRLAYIDPFDRMLKTYMFEHMISLHKQFYRTTAFNQILCKLLLILCILVFFVILTIDFFDSSSGGFFLAYIPLFASILLGLKVWNDMKPSYIVHWRMRDHTYGEIAQEPFLSERFKGDNKREIFMNELVSAMNQALSAKAWHRPQMLNATDSNGDQTTTDDSDRSHSNQSSTPRLKLVTDNYQ